MKRISVRFWLLILGAIATLIPLATSAVAHLALPVAPSETSAVSLGARCVIAISAFIANA